MPATMLAIQESECSESYKARDRGWMGGFLSGVIMAELSQLSGKTTSR